MNASERAAKRLFDSAKAWINTAEETHIDEDRLAHERDILLVAEYVLDQESKTKDRSGIDAGEIDMAVRVFEIGELNDHDQQSIVSTAACLLCSVLDNVRNENKEPKQWWMDRIKDSFTTPTGARP